RIEDRGVDAGNSNRHFKAKARIGTELDIVERAVQGRGKQGARRLDRHAVADAIRTSGPSGVDQPAGHAVTGDQITQQVAIGSRVAWHERCAEAGGEGGFRLRYALFGA